MSEGQPFIVRLEVDHMRQSILHAITDYQLQMDADIRKAVEQACSPEHVRMVIFTEAQRVLDKVLAEEIQHFYSNGPGRKFVREKVMALLGREVA